MSDDKEVNFDAIAVKDFLTEDEAAAYCGVSPSAFQRAGSSSRAIIRALTAPVAQLDRASPS